MDAEGTELRSRPARSGPRRTGAPCCFRRQVDDRPPGRILSEWSGSLAPDSFEEAAMDAQLFGLGVRSPLGLARQGLASPGLPSRNC